MSAPRIKIALRANAVKGVRKGQFERYLDIPANGRKPRFALEFSPLAETSSTPVEKFRTEAEKKGRVIPLLDGDADRHVRRAFLLDSLVHEFLFMRQGNATTLGDYVQEKIGRLSEKEDLRGIRAKIEALKRLVDEGAVRTACIAMDEKEITEKRVDESMLRVIEQTRPHIVVVHRYLAEDIPGYDNVVL
ncbi:hypothetical protein GF318_06315 [Candidatus Micrarchaeota archaeon]|nr:hypothetical protein [Candidatus Micrarchaeota archaeon]